MDLSKDIGLIDKEITDQFHDRHFDAGLLSESYERLGMEQRAQRLFWCGTDLSWRVDPDSSDAPKLYHANFCKDRLCPMCTWRRTKKIYGQVSQVMDVIEKDYRFIFLTLTIRNCSGTELRSVVDQIQNDFSLFRHYKQIKNVFKGYFKTLELTHSPHLPPSIQYHPHMHIIVAVNKSYFKSSSYLSQEKFAALWKQACGLDYTPQVDVRTVKPKLGGDGEESIKGAVCEVAKYSVKSAELLYGTNQEIDERVLNFLNALSSRRLCSFGGVFKKVAAELRLDDMLDGDLVNTDNEKLRSDVAYIIVNYRWVVGVGYDLHTIYRQDPSEVVVK